MKSLSTIGYYANFGLPSRQSLSPHFIKILYAMSSAILFGLVLKGFVLLSGKITHKNRIISLQFLYSAKNYYIHFLYFIEVSFASKNIVILWLIRYNNNTWPHRLVVRTADSHSANRDSTSRGVTVNK